MKILMLHRQDSAVGYYRTHVPARILESLGHEVTYFERNYFDALRPKRKAAPNRRVKQWLFENKGKYDLLWVDRAISREEVHDLAAFRHHSPGCHMIVDFDDAFDAVPWWNMSRSRYQPGMEAYESGFDHMRLAEMTTVSTKALARRYKDCTHKIMVRPNVLDPEDWINLRVDPERPKDNSLRILYGGASGHFEDLNQAREGLEALVKRPPMPLRVICLGSQPFWVHDLEKEYPGRVITLPWVHFENYPKAIAWGGFDLAIAPLVEDPFNECKSSIKWQEAAIQGIPMICSDTGPYAEIPDGCAIKIDNTPLQWAQALRATIEDPSLRERLKKEAYEAVMDEHTLDSCKPLLQNIVEEAMACPRIESLEDTLLPCDQPGPRFAENQEGAVKGSDKESSADARDNSDTT